jgi:hypothetical protein
MRSLALWILLAALPLLLLSSCSSDDNTDNGYGNPPVTGTLSGRVIFHGAWPDSGTVQLSVFTNWNGDGTGCSFCGEAPGGPPAYYTPAFTRPLHPTGTDTITYTISGITLGSYSAVAVGWRAPHIGSINCDEPTIGLFGAVPPPYIPDHNDSIPEPVMFTSTQPSVVRDVDAYFTMLPIPGCNDRGRIEGTVRVPGDWPPEGLLVMLTAFPASAWQPVMAAPSGYFFLHTAADTVFRFTQPFGTYYLSLWTNAAPPAEIYWYGSYGVHSQISGTNPMATDARPDSLFISDSVPQVSNLVVSGNAPAPHWISGTITFNGTRPTEGILVLVSTFMFTPEHPPTGAPSGYFLISDPNESLYAISGLPAGTYYVSLWNTSQTNSVFYGAYGYTAGSDTDPDPVTLGTTYSTWGMNSINFTGHP